MSPQRIALIEAFQRQSEGLEKKFEARTHKSVWLMPYRLFRPQAAGKLPLVLYLHGSGGLGDDNLKQLGLGNIFGTRVWLLPANQKRSATSSCRKPIADGSDTTSHSRKSSLALATATG